MSTPITPTMHRWVPFLDREVQETFLDVAERTVLLTSMVTFGCLVTGILSPALAAIAAVVTPLAIGIFVALIEQIIRNVCTRIVQPIMPSMPWIIVATVAVIGGAMFWSYLFYQSAYRPICQLPKNG
jgi:hypothetical protein